MKLNKVLRYLNSIKLEFAPKIYFDNILAIFDTIVVSSINGKVIEYEEMSAYQKNKAIENA